MRIIVIHNRHRGDLNNIVGIATAIASRTSFKTEIWHLKIRSNILIPILMLVLDYGPLPRFLARLLMRLFFAGPDNTSSLDSIAVVVSTLGAGEAPNAFIKRVTGAASIHLGSPKRVSAARLGLVIAHQGHSAKTGEITLPVSPSRILLRHFPPLARRPAMLLAIGGNTDAVVYDDPFWRALTRKTADLCSSQHKLLQITTSPRTSMAICRVIEHELAATSDLTYELVLYREDSAKSLEQLLFLAGIVIVTAESVSMISDAISSGARVVAAYSRALPDSERIRTFLNGQVAQRRLALWDIDREPKPFWDHLMPLERCWSETLWDHLDLPRTGQG